MKIRWLFITTLTFATVLLAGYQFVQNQPDTAAAAPVVDRIISGQAVAEDVAVRSVKPLQSATVFTTDDLFGYHLSYPADWLKTELSSDVVLFQATDGATRLKVEVASTLPADGLTGFVDRSLSQDLLLTRQAMTIHGLQAERLLLYSDEVGGQMTNFFITADDMVYVISGSGQQKLIESFARSFNAPQLIARR